MAIPTVLAKAPVYGGGKFPVHYGDVVEVRLNSGCRWAPLWTILTSADANRAIGLVNGADAPIDGFPRYRISGEGCLYTNHRD